MGSPTTPPSSRTDIPAFSGRALKAEEATLHKYVDLFVERMRTFGGGAEGTSLPKWTNWLSVNISADMAYNREMDSLADIQSFQAPQTLLESGH